MPENRQKPSAAPARVLIANRGEIACRIIAACRTLEHETVLICSQVDANSLAADLADRVEVVGGPAAADSYLDAEKIVRAARKHGVGLVHPGYGFLAENATFAAQVIDNGMRWIGPAPQTIAAMGDKVRAREIAQAAGVPVLPASGPLRTEEPDQLLRTAGSIGFPLLVKAAAGGGGIGMRRVDEPGRLTEVVAATRSMAGKAFGNDTVYLERFVARARHVEVQLFGFGDGQTVHMFERDCSLQRRHQKVIEESPAPGICGTTLGAMKAAATSLAAHQRYAGAGTVEFLYDVDSGDFFFLEMNTRIQVEHPVTEMVTGLDIVAMQIKLARGDLKPFSQTDVASRGHAIECRLYAEKPEKGFLPSPGRIEELSFPPAGEGVRVDTGYRAGDAITHYYDPMIAKVICHAPDRDQAIARAIDTLAETRVKGVATNRAFLLACLRDRVFRAGQMTTDFIQERGAALVAAAAAE